MTLLSRACVISLKLSISRTVSEIFSAKEQRDLETGSRGCSRSLKILARNCNYSSMRHDHDIDFAGWLHPAMWHVALESLQWIHQVAAPYSVIRGSGMTCHWIRPNVRQIRILHLVSISTTSPQSTCHSAPVSEILSKRQQKTGSDGADMICCRRLFQIYVSHHRVLPLGEFSGMSSQSHVSHCRVLPLGEFTVAIPEPRATLQRVRILSVILKIVFRHILFILLLMQFRLWRAAAFVSSPIHLF